MYARNCNARQYVACKVKFDKVRLTIAIVYLEPTTSMSLSDITHTIPKLSGPFLVLDILILVTFDGEVIIATRGES